MAIEGIENLKDDPAEVDPNVPIQTDNTERPEDGDQDVSQSSDVDYSLESE